MPGVLPDIGDTIRQCEDVFGPFGGQNGTKFGSRGAHGKGATLNNSKCGKREEREVVFAGYVQVYSRDQFCVCKKLI